MGLVQLLVEHSEIHGLAAQGALRRRARKENDWAFHYLPKIDRNYSWTEIWNGLHEGTVKGMFAIGMNGVQIGPDTRKNIEALKKAEWLVVGEIYPDETSEFWRRPARPLMR